MRLAIGVFAVLAGAAWMGYAVWRALPKEPPHDERMKRLLAEREVEESKRQPWR